MTQKKCLVGGYLNSWDYPNCLYQFNARELSVSVMDLKALILGQGSQAKQLLVWDFRLPRIVLAVLAGAALGLSGAILQGITRNPLADTGILGINAGAGLAVLFITFLSQRALSWRLASGCWDFGNRVSSSFRIDASSNGLSGCHFEYGYFSTHLINYIKIDTEKYRFVTMWQAGSIWGSNWFFVGALLPWLVIGFFLR